MRLNESFIIDSSKITILDLKLFFFRTTEKDEEEERERKHDRRREKERDRPSARRSRRLGEQDDGEGAWETVRKGVATTQVRIQLFIFDFLLRLDN